MFTLTVFKILLSKGTSVLSPAQRGAGSKRVKWIFTAVNLFSLIEWIKQNVYLHTRILPYIYRDGGSFRFLEKGLGVIASSWPNITKSRCSFVSCLRLNVVSSNPSNVGCFTQPPFNSNSTMIALTKVLPHVHRCEEQKDYFITL